MSLLAALRGFVTVVAKQFTFPDDLATTKTAHRTIIVATTGSINDNNNGHFIVQAYPDFVAPARFVAADGSIIDFAGFDEVSYPALPADGATAWYRDGTAAAGTVPGSFGCRVAPSSQCPGTIHPTPTTECAAISTRFPQFLEESTAAFYAAEPNLLTGECALQGGIDFNDPFTPVYRLWNGRPDASHRYTTSTTIRDAMIAQGWLPEGYGPLGIAMCI